MAVVLIREFGSNARRFTDGWLILHGGILNTDLLTRVEDDIHVSSGCWYDTALGEEACQYRQLLLGTSRVDRLQLTLVRIGDLGVGAWEGEREVARGNEEVLAKC